MRKWIGSAIVVVILLFAFSLAPHSRVLAWGCAYDTLCPGDVLRPGEYIGNADGSRRMYYQDDGALVVYYNFYQVPSDTFVVVGPHANPGRAIMQMDGNFVVYDGSGQAYYSSNTFPSGNFLLRISEGGHITIYANGDSIWCAQPMCLI